MSQQRIPRAARSGNQSFADVLAEAVSSRHITLDRLSQELKAAGTPVSIATLSYWQTGRSIPTRVRSLEALAVLEQLLRLPAGHLAAALPGDVPTQDSALSQLHGDDRMVRLLAELDFPPRQGFTTQTMHHRTHFSLRERQQRETVIQLIQADEDQLRRIPLMQQAEEGQTPPEMTDPVGCRIGERVSSVELGLTLIELELDQPLQLGEMAVLEHTTTWPVHDSPIHTFAHAMLRPVSFLVLELLFADALPRHVDYLRYQLGALDPDVDQAPGQPLEGTDFFQLALANAAAGTHHIRWEMP